jgi:hypothetical protein
MTNFANIMARLDPNNAMRSREFEQKFYAEAQIARFKADSDMSREHVRVNAAYDRERFKADREDSRQDRAIGAQFDLERTRGENSLSLARAEHENALERMEEDLRNHIARAGVDSGILATHKLIDEDTGRRQSLMRQIEARSQLRGDVFKMLAGAVIQEKLAQRQHLREMEKLKTTSDLRRAEYMENLTNHLENLVKQGREKEAKECVKKTIAGWEASWR